MFIYQRVTILKNMKVNGKDYPIYYGNDWVAGMIIHLVGGWATPLKNMKVSWDDYSQYMEK